MNVTPEEKLKLMLELGLENAASTFAEANNLTAMKFRPISEDKIEELLSVQYEEKTGFNILPVVAVGGFGVVAGVVLGMRPDPKIADVLHFSWTWFWLINAVTQAIGWTIGRPHVVTATAIVCGMPLQDWEFNLPYGALLSVKEAKQQGFKNFTIHFPAKESSEWGKMQVIKDDPIITAQKKGSNKLYNIFAWDDSKIYE